MKVFAISFYAPPQLTPQAIQIGRQLYHLADVEVVLMHGRVKSMQDDYDQYPDFYHRIRALDVPDPGPRLKGRLFRIARRFLPLYGDCPDEFGRWRAGASQQALVDITASRPDVLASFGMPMSDHLVALDIKRRTGLPWLAHFSDPWTDNPFHDYSWLSHRVNAAMEKNVLSAADQVLFTSQRTLDLVMSKYPDAWRDKAAVLPHAWDMGHFSDGPPLFEKRVGGRRVIRHIGNCYGTRSPVPLFIALDRISQRDPALLDGVTFEFVGNVSSAFQDAEELKALPAGLVSFRGQVGYRESLMLAQDADALLVIDADSDHPSVFLPSKLVEYIGVRRPVWGITPPGTSADLIMEWAGGRPASAPPSDLDAVARMLEDGLANLPAHADETAGPESVYYRFAPDVVGAGLRSHLQRAISAANNSGRSVR